MIFEEKSNVVLLKNFLFDLEDMGKSTIFALELRK